MEPIDVWLGLLVLCILMTLWGIYKIRSDNARFDDEWEGE